MTLEDWFIVAVLGISVLVGLSQGFFRIVFSLGGLIVGLAAAAWNYRVIAGLIMPFIRIETVADAIGFVVIALLVMGACGIFGTLLHKTFHKIGLGCLDRLGGLILGFVQGMLLVTLCILVAVAFFPEAHWLVEARLPRLFFGACHLSTHVTPTELTERIRHGLQLAEMETPWWLHPEASPK